MKPHEHIWEKDDEESSFTIHRFRCLTCPADGWRKAIPTTVLNRQIKEYRGEVPVYAKQAEVTARPRSVGTNAAGRLPASRWQHPRPPMSALAAALVNPEYQRLRDKLERLQAEEQTARRWYAATDTRAHLIEAEALKRRAARVERELGDILTAIARPKARN